MLVIISSGNWRISDVVYGIVTDILLETEVCISPKVISRKEYNRLYNSRKPFHKKYYSGRDYGMNERAYERVV